MSYDKHDKKDDKGKGFALVVVLFILLIIVGTAWSRPYVGHQPHYGHYMPCCSSGCGY
nr:YjcZ family sporulation protein [Salsuginibacillus kocurii]